MPLGPRGSQRHHLRRPQRGAGGHPLRTLLSVKCNDSIAYFSPSRKPPLVKAGGPSSSSTTRSSPAATTAPPGAGKTAWTWADAGVDDQPAAHGAGGGAGDQLAGFGVLAGHVEGGPQHLAAGGGDDGVGLRVDGAAQLIPLPGGNVHGLPGAVAQVHAVFPPPGGAVVAGGHNLVPEGAVKALFVNKM